MATRSDIETATAFLTMCAAGHVQEAYAAHVSDDFRHHNAYFPSDRESLLRGMEESAKSQPNKSFTVKQTLESGDRVATLSHVRLENSDIDIAVVHILRFENGRISEMWDIGQQIPKDSPNALGMF